MNRIPNPPPPRTYEQLLPSRKYRILEKNGQYYPQHRNWLGFWCYYKDLESFAAVGTAYTITKSFRTLKEARQYLSGRIPKPKSKPIVHHFYTDDQ